MREKLECLISHGVDTRARDSKGRGCLHILFQETFEGGFYHICNVTRPEYIAIARSVLSLMCCLIRNGADIHAVDSYGFSVTERAHWCRLGRLWEAALVRCRCDVEQVYIRDYRIGNGYSDDIYAPNGCQPRQVRYLYREYYACDRKDERFIRPRFIDAFMSESLFHDDADVQTEASSESEYPSLESQEDSEEWKEGFVIGEDEMEDQEAEKDMEEIGAPPDARHDQVWDATYNELEAGLSESDDEDGGVPVMD